MAIDQDYLRKALNYIMNRRAKKSTETIEEAIAWAAVVFMIPIKDLTEAFKANMSKVKEERDRIKDMTLDEYEEEV